MWRREVGNMSTGRVGGGGGGNRTPTSPPWIFGKSQNFKKILSRVRVTYKTGYWIKWLDLLTPYAQCSELQANNTALSLTYTLYNSPLHTRTGFSVFTSRIPATDLQQSHCHLKWHMKFSYHSLIPFLPLFCNSQLRRLDSVQFQAHIPAGWPPEARLFTSCCWTLLYNHFARTTQETQPLLLRRRVYWSVA
jgi:hypothetical protein